LNTSTLKPRALTPSSRLSGHRAREGHAAVGPRLQTSRASERFADGAQGGDGVGRAAQDVDLFLGADDQVAEGQHLLQLAGDVLVLDEAVLAGVLAGQAPQHRAVVDVEGHPAAGRLDRLGRLQAGRVDAGLRQVGAVDQHRAGPGEPGLVDVAGLQRHVGAVLAIEDQRKGVAVADAQDDQGGQALGVGQHAGHVDALAGQLFADEAAHVVGADPGQQAGLQTQARAARGGVGRAAAQVLGERGHVLQPSADLLAVEVHAGTAHGDQIESFSVLRHASSTSLGAGFSPAICNAYSNSGTLAISISF
jgi:hypothetical protein